MKGNAAISFGVSRNKTEPEKLRMVPAAYGIALKALAQKHDLGWERVAELAAVSTVTAWRVTKGDGTVATADKLRHALQREFIRRGIAEQVPPLVVKPPPGLEEWVGFGRVLLDDDPIAFAETIASVRTIVQGVEQRRQARKRMAETASGADRSADGGDLSSIRIGAEPVQLPGIAPEPDRGSGYRASNDEDAKGPVDRPRKPPRRRRPGEVRPRR